MTDVVDGEEPEPDEHAEAINATAIRDMPAKRGALLAVKSARILRLALEEACNVRQRWLVVAVVALAALGASCTGDDGSDAAATTSTTSSPEWDSVASSTAAQVARDLARRVDDGCTDYALYPRRTYVASAEQIGSDVPLAVGSCMLRGEEVEISVFANREKRDAFVDQRSEIICTRASRVEYELPGLYWVAAENWSLQPDSEALARDLARLVGGEFVARTCP